MAQTIIDIPDTLFYELLDKAENVSDEEINEWLGVKDETITPVYDSKSSIFSDGKTLREMVFGRLNDMYYVKFNSKDENESTTQDSVFLGLSSANTVPKYRYLIFSLFSHPLGDFAPVLKTDAHQNYRSLLMDETSVYRMYDFIIEKEVNDIELIHRGFLFDKRAFLRENDEIIRNQFANKESVYCFIKYFNDLKVCRDYLDECLEFTHKNNNEVFFGLKYHQVVTFLIICLRGCATFNKKTIFISIMMN